MEPYGNVQSIFKAIQDRVKRETLDSLQVGFNKAVKPVADYAWQTIQGQTPLMQKAQSYQTKEIPEFTPATGTAFSALSPLETATDYLISKDRGGIKEAVQRGGDIPGALMSRGMSPDIAMNLGMAMAMVMPGAGELSSMGRASKIPATDLEGVEPVINTKRQVPVTDIYGQKSVIKEGEPLAPFKLKNNKWLLQDDDTYIVNKSQYENIKNQSATKQPAKPFNPEFEGTIEIIRGTEADKRPFKDIQEQIANDRYRKYYIDLNEIEKNTVDLLAKERQRGVGILKPTKYEDYTLPGGKNYREILIRAPNKSFPDFIKNIIGEESYKKLNEIELRQWADRFEKQGGEIEPGFKSSHWEEPNVISHLRINDREYKGKPVTFIEEAQSDWALENRKILDAAKKGEIDSKQIQNVMDEFIIDEQDAINAIKKNPRLGTYEPPQVTNWLESTLKRALKEAVDSDSEYLAWTTGQQQKDRYKLSKEVDKITWVTPTKSAVKSWGETYVPHQIATIFLKNKNDSIDLKIDLQGKILDSAQAPQNWKNKNISDVIGKGIAEKIMAKPRGSLSGSGLDVGGQWAINLYDKQFGEVFKKITGENIETIDLGVSGKKKYYDVTLGTSPYLPEVTKNDIRSGMIIKDHNRRNYSGNEYMILDVSKNGMAKVINYDTWFDTFNTSEKGNWSFGEKKMYMMYDSPRKNQIEEIDLSGKTDKQQAIKITPKIRALVKGEEIPLKQPKGTSPFAKTHAELLANPDMLLEMMNEKR